MLAPQGGELAASMHASWLSCFLVAYTTRAGNVSKKNQTGNLDLAAAICLVFRRSTENGMNGYYHEEGALFVVTL